jgi:hypothetical protein
LETSHHHDCAEEQYGSDGNLSHNQKLERAFSFLAHATTLTTLAEISHDAV